MSTSRRWSPGGDRSRTFESSKNFDVSIEVPSDGEKFAVSSTRLSRLESVQPCSRTIDTPTKLREAYPRRRNGGTRVAAKKGNSLRSLASKKEPGGVSGQ